MKPYLTVLATVVFAVAISAKPFKDGDEIDSYESAFHYMLHDSAEFYLVCIYEVEKKPWMKEWEQLDIKATVVDPIKGGKKIGDQIEYNRVYDGKIGDISGLKGALKFVRLIRAEDKPQSVAFVDSQDPQSVFRYSPEFHAVARDHREQNKAQHQKSDRAGESKVD